MDSQKGILFFKLPFTLSNLLLDFDLHVLDEIKGNINLSLNVLLSFSFGAVFSPVSVFSAAEASSCWLEASRTGVNNSSEV